MIVVTYLHPFTQTIMFVQLSKQFSEVRHVAMVTLHLGPISWRQIVLTDMLQHSALRVNYCEWFWKQQQTCSLMSFKDSIC